MDPDIVAGLSAGLVACILFFGVFMMWAIPTMSLKKRVVLSLLSPVVLCIVWLVSPWIALGIHTVHRTNVGAVNDIQRQEKVLEPEEIIRPSKADKEGE